MALTDLVTLPLRVGVAARTLEAIAPRLGDLGEVVPELHEAVTALNATVGPLGELAGRLPGGRRRNALEA